MRHDGGQLRVGVRGRKPIGSSLSWGAEPNIQPVVAEIKRNEEY